MKIVLSGYYGFDNAGDEALLAAITSTIRELEPDCEFVVLSGHPRRTSGLHNIPSVHYMNPCHIIKALWGCDLLISGGGSIFQDVTSARTLPYYISVVALARALGKPVIFYAQGMGPINRSFSKFLMRRVGNRVNLITLRDEESARYAESLGITRPPVVITADPVFSLQPEDGDHDMIERVLAKKGLTDARIIGVALRKWESLDKHLDNLPFVLDELADMGYRILFIPLAYPEDLEAENRVAALMRNQACFIEEHLSSREHLALFSRLHLLIGMRLHALIFAASQGVPFAGISYDPKVEAFLRQFGLKSLDLDLEAMRKEILRLLEPGEARGKILEEAAELRSRSRESARLAIGLIRGK
jgi:polysaccharide pyruvyl transferase CsaB